MRPFNIGKALAGAAVVTRAGRRVTQLKVFTAAHDSRPLVGVVDGDIRSWRRDGTYPDSEFDLFMPAKNHVAWVNVCEDGVQQFFTNKDDALIASRDTEKFLTSIAVKIEWSDNA